MVWSRAYSAVVVRQVGLSSALLASSLGLLFLDQHPTTFRAVTVSEWDVAREAGSQYLRVVVLLPGFCCLVLPSRRAPM